MTFSIETLGAEPSRITSLIEMLQEMQAHYDVPCPSADDILRGLIERPKGAEIIVAMDASTMAGFAAFSAIYPGPYLQAGLFLKELYVRGAYRGRGIGQEMLAHLARLARDRGLSRIDWTADANDERLLRFYDSIGGQQKPDKIFYRLDGDALKRLAS
ncbi:GNAT family N-acetyltransferase [Neorhizobium galegae]|uniref:GNAT family N-acetyltransferase n=1 Tax=Neorhizobium galegae TaxID=399 RepID=UPI001F34AD76|nr:GNAT family N-acetyltransferase [Neorhizobium galegae]UIK08834.1 GNAT family N-acetyltransferase [Neorhizobium galegae]